MQPSQQHPDLRNFVSPAEAGVGGHIPGAHESHLVPEITAPATEQPLSPQQIEQEAFLARARQAVEDARDQMDAEETAAGNQNASQQ